MGSAQIGRLLTPVSAAVFIGTTIPVTSEYCCSETGLGAAVAIA
jgi:hypothetical protein